MELDDIDNAPIDQKMKLEKYKEVLERAVSTASEQQIKDLVVHGNGVVSLMLGCAPHCGD